MKYFLGLALIVAFCCLPSARAADAPDTGDAGGPPKQRFSGNVSWYGVPFHGRKTASGMIFDMTKTTAAHKKLPFYTLVLVENPKNGKTVKVWVTDRGPFVRTRVMDLSREAARRLGILLGGIAWVDCVVIGSGTAQDIK